MLTDFFLIVCSCSRQPTKQEFYLKECSCSVYHREQQRLLLFACRLAPHRAHAGKEKKEKKKKRRALERGLKRAKLHFGIVRFLDSPSTI